MGLLFDAVQHALTISSIDRFETMSIRVSSLACLDGEHLIAATFGQGIYIQSDVEKWERMDAGLPSQAIVYRLHVIEQNLLASTDQGLYYWNDKEWENAGLRFSCHRVAKSCCSLLAATDQGLAVLHGNHQWKCIAFEGKHVYDMVSTPNYLFVAFEKGVAYYDVLTGDWYDYQLTKAVTSLVLYQDYILGITTDGCLIQSDRRGGFQAVRFEGKCFYQLFRFGNQLLACSNQGLYRVELRSSGFQLQLMGISCPVTDVIEYKDRMIAATMHYGLLSLPNPQGTLL
ncbi:hypothetical protein [Paenibacillus turpanensis]|uniref:hypothetical protein n=1 Tax=Paenibacillus turpanensis TaxID=2689078 RepID=UPI00140DB1BC|nr:hypothetical protein [Paenibacillus turpanensis]